MSFLRKKHAYSPRLETLEDRCTPAVSVSPVGSTLMITSNNAADTISVRDNGDGDVTVNFSGGSFSGNNFRRIYFSLNGGNDRFTYRQTGNRTRDMYLRGSMGSGRDLFTGRIQGDINANRTLRMRLFGNSGADGMDLTSNSDVDIQSGALYRVQMYGGSSRDRVDFNYQGEIDGLLRYQLEGDSGDDNGAGFVRATIRADLGSTGQIGIVGETALVSGDSGDDNLGHFVFKHSSDIFLAVSALVDGGPGDFFFLAGNDVCNHTTNVVSINCESEFIT
jgi:hypothetical protein